MNVGELKKIIENKSDTTEVILAGYNSSKGTTILRRTYQCCNLEYQEKNKEVWLSMEGLLKK